MRERATLTKVDKVDSIRSHFASLTGSSIVRYSTAQFQYDDCEWLEFPDLPIRIYTSNAAMVSISWSKFDELWLSDDETVFSWAAESKVRWIDDGCEAINEMIGRSIKGVSLGRGQMSIEGSEIEIWTRLLIELDDCWLEVFNALDENGYDLHRSFPVGEFVSCI